LTFSGLDLAIPAHHVEVHGKGVIKCKGNGAVKQASNSALVVTVVVAVAFAVVALEGVAMLKC
jgi:hypothetical protein